MISNAGVSDTNTVAALSTTQVDALGTTQLSNLTTAQVAGLTTAQAASLGTRPPVRISSARTASRTVQSLARVSRSR